MRKINLNERFKFYAVLWILFLPFFACCDSGKSEIKIVNWNVQTFFDATNDGTEYFEFVKRKLGAKKCTRSGSSGFVLL